jgi:hypothetical protein
VAAMSASRRRGGAAALRERRRLAELPGAGRPARGAGARPGACASGTTPPCSTARRRRWRRGSSTRPPSCSFSPATRTLPHRAQSLRLPRRRPRWVPTGGGSTCTVRARPGRSRGCSVCHRESVLCGAFVWARRALHS